MSNATKEKLAAAFDAAKACDCPEWCDCEACQEYRLIMADVNQDLEREEENE